MKCNALNQAPGFSLLQDIIKNKNKMFFFNAPVCCHVSYMLANMSEHFLKEAQRSTWKGLANSPHFELNAKKKATVLHWLYTRTHTWKLEPNDQLSRFFSLQCVTWMLRVWCFVCSTHYSAAHNYTSSQRPCFIDMIATRIHAYFTAKQTVVNLVLPSADLVQSLVLVGVFTPPEVLLTKHALRRDKD